MLLTRVHDVLLLREKLEENLVNSMETIDNDLGTGQSAASNKPTLMFKIASKSKKHWAEGGRSPRRKDHIDLDNKRMIVTNRGFCFEKC